MLTDDQARALLGAAARTIDVDPTGASSRIGPTTPRRPWRVAAAAAAAAVVVVGVALGTRGGDTEPAPSPESVPSVLGLLRDDAVARLESAGLEVRVTTQATCAPDGAALDVTRQGRGAVTLLVNDLAGVELDCPELSEPAWAFVGMLNGGPEVPTDRAVALRVDGSRPRFLQASQVADVGDWGGPAATALRTALADPATTLATEPLEACSGPLPATGADGPGVLLVGPDVPCGTRLSVRLDADERVVRVGVTTSTAPPVDQAPDLVGLPEQDARAALAGLVDPAQVFVVRPEGSCAQPQTVEQQRPGAGGRLRGSVVLTIPTDTAGCTKPASDGAAEQAAGQALVAFADGGPAPALADRVRLFAGRAPVGTLTREQAADPDAWRGCPDAPGYTCPVSLLAGLSTAGPDPYDVAVRAEPVLNPCGSWLAAPYLPTRITAYDSFFLSPPQDEITCAYGFRLQVFLDAQDRITAVDLARTEP